MTIINSLLFNKAIEHYLLLNLWFFLILTDACKRLNQNTSWDYKQIVSGVSFQKKTPVV
jgi:hypothetical protein